MPAADPRPARSRRARPPRPASPEQRADAGAAREQRLAALHQQLADGVAAIGDGDAWQDWLATAAKFHRYSFNNQILIAAQRPGATAVAGYGAWQALGRQVRKGETALWILAPVTVRAPAPAPGGSTDPAPRAGDGPDAGPAARRLVGFRPAAVFDVSQTDGDPLPAPPRPALLAGQAPAGLWDGLAAAAAGRGFEVRRSPDAAALHGANGVTDFAARTITVRSDVDDAQAVKTLAHEAGHVLLHDPAGADGGGAPAGAPACRDLIEVEAESVAYLVAGHHGLDSSGYTFAYIAGWAGRDTDAVTATAKRVLAAATTLIDATDPAAAGPPQGAGPLAATGSSTTTTITTDAASAADRAATNAEATRDRVQAAAAAPGEDRLRATLAAAHTWFQAQAAGSSTFRTAVTARGHTPEAALGYGAGYAPPGWTGLVDHLRDLGHTPEELLAAGVASTTRHGRLIDRFRGRITFPIHDRHGTVGFTARDTTGNPEAPKYLNTPAGGLYDKSGLLFGTQHLPPASRARTVVLVEGPWDALAVTAAGGGTCIGLAACGTAVTEAHLDLASGAGDALVLAPDNDPAGTAALARTVAMLAARGHPHPRAAGGPAGSDLAELYATAGPDAVRDLLAHARPAAVVHAAAVLALLDPPDSIESRHVNARTAAKAAAGLDPAGQVQLTDLLTGYTRVSPEAARSIVTDAAARQVVPPKPGAAPAAPVVRVPAAAGRGCGPRL